MKRSLIAAFALTLLSLAPSAFAQTPVTGTVERPTWDQIAQDLPTAQATYGYEYKVDGGVVFTPLTGITCTGATSPFVCSSVWPVGISAPGVHSLVVFATLMVGNVKLYSTTSNTLSINLKAPASAPTNFRITAP